MEVIFSTFKTSSNYGVHSDTDQFTYMCSMHSVLLKAKMQDNHHSNTDSLTNSLVRIGP